MLKSMIDDERAWDYMAGRLALMQDDFESLSETDQMIRLITAFEGEARRATVAGFLGNPYGVHVYRLIEELTKIQAAHVAHDLAKLTANIRGFHPGFPKDNFFIDAYERAPAAVKEEHDRLNQIGTTHLRQIEPTLVQLLHAYLEGGA